MTLPKLTFYSRPEKNVLFSKTIRKGETRFHDVIWQVTKEENCLIIWRGHCTEREQPWEESDWHWGVKEILLHRNEAIETCVLLAIEDSHA